MRFPRWVAMMIAACGSPGVHHLSDGGGDAAHDSTTRDATSTNPAPGIYVASANNAVTVFALDASGDVAPTRTIAGSATQLSLPIDVAVDGTGDLYVANRTGSAVTVYAPDATGDVAPVRTLTGSGMGSPQGLAIAADGELFATACPSCGESAGGTTGIFHFAAGATTSDRSLVDPTNLTAPDSLATDPAGDLVVGNGFGGSVATYPAAATGSAAATRAFTPAGDNIQSIGVGSAMIAVTTPGAGVALYALDAAGSDAPAATLATGSAFALQYPGGVFVDRAVSPELVYVVDYEGNAVYVLTTTGTEPDLSLASVRTITGSNTALASPLQIVVVD